MKTNTVIVIPYPTFGLLFFTTVSKLFLFDPAQTLKQLFLSIPLSIQKEGHGQNDRRTHIPTMTAPSSRSGSHTAHISSSYLNTREYEETTMIKRFVPIVDAIRSRSEKELGFDSSDVTSRALSTLTGNLRAFVETALGKNARNPPPNTPHITKFPDKLFSDYRPDGSLSIMLCACLNYKCLLGVRRLEFQNIDKASHLYDLLVRIEKDLRNADMLPLVKVYFSRSVPSASLPELKTIMQKRGSIVSSASAATHVIYSDPKDTTASETAGTDYCRPLKFSDTHAFVHWWYYPDSYDSWIPRGDVDDVIEPVEEHQGPWHVQMRWLHDTELYNEWMNEADYEVPTSMRGKSHQTSRIDPTRAPSRIETVQNTQTPSTRTETERSSKKRKRSSHRESDRSVEKGVENNDEMDLGDSPADSDPEISNAQRIRRSNNDGSTRDRKSRDARRDFVGEKSHPRKKARLSDEKRISSTGKGESSHSVKVRLYLKPPPDLPKERSKDKDRKKESKIRDTSKSEGRSREKVKADSRMKDTKIDVKLREGVKAKEAVKEILKVKESSKSKESSKHRDKFRHEPKTEDSQQATNSDREDLRRGKEIPMVEKLKGSSRSDTRETDSSRAEGPGGLTKSKDATLKYGKKDKTGGSPKKDVSVETKMASTGPKVRIKLGGKVTEANPQSHLPESTKEKSPDRDPESPQTAKVERSAARSSADLSHSFNKSASTAGDIKKNSNDVSLSLKSSDERRKLSHSDPVLKDGEAKQGAGTLVEAGQSTVGDMGQEQRKPFSRRKRSRKERNQQNRAPGLTVVEDAIPISEGDVPRIRNISHDGTEPDGAVSIPDPMDIDIGMKSIQRKVEHGDFVDKGGDDGQEPNPTIANGATSNEINSSGPFDHGRVTAVAEKSISGFVANAPASSVDLVESVPPIKLRMPAHARWFRLDAIHDIEKRSLPEFFDRRSQSKSPPTYKKYRDFMVNVWRQAPEKYMSATVVRRHLTGDVCAVLRVFMFLERWGLINYGVDPEGKPHINSSLKSRGVRPKPIVLDGHSSEPINGVPRLFFFDEPKSSKRNNAPISLQKAVKCAKEKSMMERGAMLTKRELYATAAATKHECDGCGKDCSRMRYHCVANIDMELCPDCFANGRFPQTLSARDFEQLTTMLSSEAYDGSVWSEGEALLLLEGLERFGDDWNKVAEHVGSKSKEQCVLQFLKMPIEDSFLGDQFGKWDPDHATTNDVDVIQEGEADGEVKFASPDLPFADASNPVMGQVAFLASCVSPEVASAAAQAALTALLKESGESVSEGTESKSDQAKALLRSPEKDHPGTGAGVTLAGERAMVDAKSKLASLSTKELDSMAVEAAASVGLAAAVVRGRQLGDAETREMERCFAAAVETKMKMVDLKMHEFERLEQYLQRERDRLEKQRMTLYAARIDASAKRSAPSLYPPAGQQTNIPGQPPETHTSHYNIASIGAPLNPIGARNDAPTVPSNLTMPGANSSAGQPIGGALQSGGVLPGGQLLRSAGPAVAVGAGAGVGVVGGVPPMAGVPLTTPSSMQLVGVSGQSQISLQTHISRDSPLGVQSAMAAGLQGTVSSASLGAASQTPGGGSAQVQLTPGANPGK